MANYPTFRPQPRKRIDDMLPRPTLWPKRTAGEDNSGAQQYPVFRRPVRDERLTGDDAELARREAGAYPTFRRPGGAVELEPTQVYPTFKPRFSARVPGSDLHTDPPMGNERLSGQGDAELALKQKLDAQTQGFVDDGGAVPLSGGIPEASIQPSAPLLGQHLLDLIRGKVVDKNGRMMSGALAAAAGLGRRAQSDSLARAAGTAAGGFFGGLLNSKWDEERQRAVDIEKAKGAATIESQQDKERREREEHRANIANKEASTRNLNSLPTWREQQQASREREANTRAILSIYNKMDTFDPNDAANADMVASMRALGLPVAVKTPDKDIKIVQDPRTGGYHVIATDKKTATSAAAPVNAPPTAPGETPGQFSTSTPQQMTAEQQEANRISRENIAAQNRASQERRAALKISNTGALSASERRTVERRIRTLRAEEDRYRNTSQNQMAEQKRKEREGYEQELSGAQPAPSSGGGQTWYGGIKSRAAGGTQQGGQRVSRSKLGDIAARMSQQQGRQVSEAEAQAAYEKQGYVFY